MPGLHGLILSVQPPIFLIPCASQAACTPPEHGYSSAMCCPRLSRLLCGAIVCLLCASAQAQSGRLYAPDRLQVNEPTNIFLTWDGQQPIEGLRLSLPGSWSLRGASAVGSRRHQITLAIERHSGGRYVLRAPQALTGPQRFVIRLLPGPGATIAEWAIEPFYTERLQRGTRDIIVERFHQTTRVQDASPSSTNRAFYLDVKANGPVLLRPADLPELGSRYPFTVEFWLKTTGLNEIILSTWDEDEQHPYPLEMMINESGHLVFYRGQPGLHQSLVTATPVADGSWHHIAVTNNPVRGWTRLLLDGKATDSLYTPTSLDDARRSPLALGNRQIATDQKRPTFGNFSGLLDELRIWRRFRNVSAVQRTMRQTLPAASDAFTGLQFDEWPLPRLIMRWPEGAERAPASPPFNFPVRAFRVALAEEVVQLTWETLDRQAEAFVIEKSADGQRFVSAGTVTRRDHEGETSDGALRFTFQDTHFSDPVAYYRIRQRFADGSEQVSDVVKVAMPREMEPELLFSNSPNPFRTSTVITYEIKENQHVRLSVWDVNGHRIAVLVDGEQAPGIHDALFESSDLPSGIYFARLNTRHGMLTRKIILAK